MQRRRPTSVTVIAILHFVFGGVGLLCGICVAVGDLAGMSESLAAADPAAREKLAEQKRRKEVTDQVNREMIPLYRPYTVTNRVLSVISTILLLVSGVGLILLRAWGRWLSIVWAVQSLGTNLLATVYLFLFFQPAQAEVMRRLPPQNEQEQLAHQFAGPLAPACTCMFAIYPTVVLIIMFLPTVVAAFRVRRIAAADEV
jgi:hypothetical protein